jgi:hypothetical protein
MVVVALRLAVRLRRGKFGSRLLIKLAGIFALVGLLPGLVIYTVSYQFVSRSIEAWFDVKVAGALDAGLALGKGTLDALTADVLNKTRVARRTAGRHPAWPWCRWRWSGCASRSARNEASLVTGQRPGAADRWRRGIGRPARASRLGPDAPGRLLGSGQRHRRAGRRIAGAQQRSARTSARWPACRAANWLLAVGEERFVMVLQPIQRALAATRWPCRRPTANTSSARWAATACAACTSAR